MTTDPNHRLARLLFCSWTCAGGGEYMPAEPGVLDSALQRMATSPKFPAWARSQLHFMNGHSGLRCLESETILAAAQDAQLTSEPNPTYSRVRVRLTAAAARHLLRKLDISEDDAKSLGEALRAAFSADAQPA